DLGGLPFADRGCRRQASGPGPPARRHAGAARTHRRTAAHSRPEGRPRPGAARVPPDRLRRPDRLRGAAARPPFPPGGDRQRGGQVTTRLLSGAAWRVGRGGRRHACAAGRLGVAPGAGAGAAHGRLRRHPGNLPAVRPHAARLSGPDQGNAARGGTTAGVRCAAPACRGRRSDAQPARCVRSNHRCRRSREGRGAAHRIRTRCVEAGDRRALRGRPAHPARAADPPRTGRPAAAVGPRGRRRQPTGDRPRDGGPPDSRGARPPGAPAARSGTGPAVFTRRTPPPSQAAGERLLQLACAVVPGIGPRPAHRAGRADQRMSMDGHMAEADGPQEQQPAPLVLRILSGLHDGASRVLGPQEMLLIGSGEDCDIILSDPGVARHHAMVLRHGDTLSLRAIDAPLEFAGDPLEPGDPIDLPLLEPARLGGVSVAIGPADAAGWTALGATPGAVTTTPPPPLPASRPMLPTALVAVALLSLVSVGIYAMVRPAAEPEATPRERAGIFVDEYGIRDSELIEARDDAIVLAGTVEDAATAARLEQRIVDEALPIQLRLRTGDDVARDVREVLRTFGIAAGTRYEGNGAVRVEP